jgi:hypothetical protein
VSEWGGISSELLLARLAYFHEEKRGRRYMKYVKMREENDTNPEMVKILTSVLVACLRLLTASKLEFDSDARLALPHFASSIGNRHSLEALTSGVGMQVTILKQLARIRVSLQNSLSLNDKLI